MNQREEDGGPLGVLNREQQHYFRAAIELPLTITNSRGDTFEARTINISSGGMCIDGIDKPFQLVGILDVRFPMPDTGMLVEAKAQVAWADVHKKAGLRFTEFPADAQTTLDRWLNSKQHEEGWTVAV